MENFGKYYCIPLNQTTGLSNSSHPTLTIFSIMLRAGGGASTIFNFYFLIFRTRKKTVDSKSEKTVKAFTPDVFVCSLIEKEIPSIVKTMSCHVTVIQFV